jgi:glycosyltransferase involved in cell wall biosynthesis
MLRDTLLGLREQKTCAGDSYEVVVIDNDPEGSAQPVVEELRREWPAYVELRYIHETRVGLSFARNRGIDEARGEIIGFLDDDLFVPPGWLSAVLGVSSGRGPLALVAAHSSTGRTTPMRSSGPARRSWLP